MQEKINMSVCEMRKLSRAFWCDSFTAGQSLHPVWAIPNNMARAGLNQQRCFSPLPQAPLRFDLRFDLRLFCYKAWPRQCPAGVVVGTSGPWCPTPALSPRAPQRCPTHPGARLDTHCFHCTFPHELLWLSMIQDMKAQLHFVNVLQTRLFLTL